VKEWPETKGREAGEFFGAFVSRGGRAEGKPFVRCSSPFAGCKMGDGIEARAC